MSIGFGQLIIIIILIVLLFGKFPNFIRDINAGLRNLNKHLEEKTPPKIESKSSKKKD